MFFDVDLLSNYAAKNFNTLAHTYANYSTELPYSMAISDFSDFNTRPNSYLSIYVFFLRFYGHFPGEPGLAGFIGGGECWKWW